MSALSDLVATLAAGDWAELTSVTGIVGSLVAGSGPNSTLASGAHTIEWDDTRSLARGAFKDHGFPVAGFRELAYRESTNEWTFEQDFDTTVNGHAYDHNAMDPDTGILYHRVAAGNATSDIWSCPPGGSWSLLTSWTPLGFINVALGVCCWTGSFTGVTGKALMVYQCGDVGEIQVYDITADVWRTPVTGFDAIASQHGFMEYSRGHNVAVLGGGNDNPLRVWRLNSNGTVTNLSDAPWRLGPVGALPNPNLICEDPATGNFILVNGTSRDVYELDPTDTSAGAYTQLADAPAGVGSFNFFAFPIHPQGVIAYITCSSSDGTMFLYKNGEGAIPEVKLAMVLR